MVSLHTFVQIFPPTILNMMGGTKVLPLYKKEEHAKNVQNIEITATTTYIYDLNFPLHNNLFFH